MIYGDDLCSFCSTANSSQTQSAQPVCLPSQVFSWSDLLLWDFCHVSLRNINYWVKDLLEILRSSLQINLLFLQNKENKWHSSSIIQTIKCMPVDFFFVGNISLISITYLNTYTYTWTLSYFSILYTLSFWNKYFCDCDKW